VVAIEADLMDIHGLVSETQHELRPSFARLG
jgi:hypothetical protein